MTREEAVKAAERVSRYFEETLEEPIYEMAMYGFNNEDYREAWIRTCEELEYDELDTQSKIWFIENDDEFESAFEILKEDYKKGLKFSAVLSKHMAEIDD